MAHTLAKTEQNIRNSSQVLDSKCEDGVRSHPTEQSLSFAKATAAKQPGDCVHRRSLLPKKTAPGSCGSTRVVPEDTQHTSAIVGSNAQVIPDAFSNPNTSNKFILSRSTQKKSQSASKAQKIPVKNLERSLSARNRGIAPRSLTTSQTTDPGNVSISLGLQSSLSAEIGTSDLSTKRDSASASKMGPIRSDTPKSSINSLKHTTARGRIRYQSRSTQSSGEALGDHRTNSYQIAKNSVPASTLLRLKDVPSHKLPIKVDRTPLSALNQDFAPKESSKLATASSANAISVDAEPEMTPDQIVRLQMELMQLSVLHGIAVETQRQWEQSAERILHHRFDVVCKEHERVKRLVQVQKVSEAQAALVRWYGNMTSGELAVKVQLLSRNIFETWQLTNPDGEYTRLIGTFENWFDKARGVQSSRKPSYMLVGQEIDLIETIEDGWALEVENMESRLSSSLRGLEYIGELPGKTDFGQLLFSFKKLLRNLLEEMGIIRAIQSDIMASEISWIQRCIDNDAGQYDDL